jgi:hypothetical protein
MRETTRQEAGLASGSCVQHLVGTVLGDESNSYVSERLNIPVLARKCGIRGEAYRGS